ncbi:DUF3370 domain-containing protein [Trichothermofontia sp.]
MLLPLLPLPAGSATLIAQTPAPPPEIVHPQIVRPLPGQLDIVPVFNSNSPELVLEPGILLSTFPPQGKRVPAAHLHFPFQGRFDVFAHHVARAKTPEDLRTLYVAVLLWNPSDRPVTIDILQGASYLSQPDAPFIPLPSIVENPLGTVFSGPGSRVVGDILRGQRQAIFPPQLRIAPRSEQLLFNLPIPVKTLDPPLNGRSTLMRLRSSGPVYAASLAQFATVTTTGEEQPPSLDTWRTLLTTGGLAGPRDRAPSPIGKPGPIVYGRVAGVAQGSQWQAQLTDAPDAPYLSIPAPGTAVSYGLATLYGGQLGTGQNQSARLLVRYPDTAYEAHGNYGIHYSLTLPLHNAGPTPQTVVVKLQTPIKEEVLSQNGLRFFDPPPDRIFFRGPVRVRFVDDRGLPQIRDVHLVQKRGQPGDPLVQLRLPAGDRRLVSVDFLYPPDATPPQVLTIETLGSESS